MNRQQAHDLIKETFEQPFEKARFIRFIKELLNKIDESKAFHARGDVKEIFNPIIKTYERIGSYESPNGEKLDIVIAYLQKTHSIDYARVTQRNFAGKYLSDRGQKDAGLFAFVTPDKFDWRFSLVKMDYKFEKTSTGSTKVKEEYTPARRWSFLVGANEGSHTERVAIARAIVNEPPIILADEPTGNLDSKTTIDIMKLLAQLNENGTTIIMVTHNPLCAQYARRILKLSDGMLMSDER